MKLKNEIGITLLALVITIIILLILAGVTISMLANEGIIGKANLAKERYENAQDYENNQLDKFDNLIDKYNTNNTNNKEKLFAYMFSFVPNNVNWNAKNVEEALDFLYNN